MFRRDPDGAIYRLLLRRGPDGLELLADKYGGLLERFVWGILGTGRPEDIEEVVNDTLFAVWCDVGEYDPERARFKTWVFMKARYCALGQRRKLARELKSLQPLHPEEIPRSYGDLILRIDLALALTEMSESDRQAVYFCDYLGVDRQEVAARLGVKGKALDMRLHRARKRLQRALRAWRPRSKVREDSNE